MTRSRTAVDNNRKDLIDLLPPRGTLEQKLIEHVLEAKRTLATIKFLDAIGDIQVSSTQELELLEGDLDELSDECEVQLTSIE